MSSIALIPQSKLNTDSTRIIVFTVLALIVLTGLFFLISLLHNTKNYHDILIINGVIVSEEFQILHGNVIAIKDGKISYVGLKNGAPKAKVVIDAREKTVMSSFGDAHVHLVNSFLEMYDCSLFEAGSIEEVFEVVEGCENRGGWIVATGWGMDVFGESGPTAVMLDGVTGDVPAVLTSSDGHSVWVNSAAMVISGVGENTVDPPGGIIDRIEGTNIPSGIFRESAVDLITAFVPPYSEASYDQAVIDSINFAHSNGITRYIEANCDRACVESYVRASKKNILKADIAISLKYKDDVADLLEIRDLVNSLEIENIKIETVKLFLDGVLETLTGAVIEPYVGHPNNHGILMYDEHELKTIAEELTDHGFSIHMHAIGDLAVRTGLNALEELPRFRHQMAHLQLIHPDDYHRFKSLEIIPNFSPYWFINDSSITEFTTPVIGEERSQRLYPINSVCSEEFTCNCGSDWSVTTINVIAGIQRAVFRGSPNQPLILKEQGISIENALRCYTSNVAFAMNLESVTGSLSIGKSADLIIIDHPDITQLTPLSTIDLIHTTIYQGEIVYLNNVE